jgi:hypothetical protein
MPKIVIGYGRGSEHVPIQKASGIPVLDPYMVSQGI